MLEPSRGKQDKARVPGLEAVRKLVSNAKGSKPLSEFEAVELVFGRSAARLLSNMLSRAVEEEA